MDDRNKKLALIRKSNAKVFAEYNKNRKIRPEEYLTEMKNPQNALEIEDLRTFFFTDAGTVKAVNGVTINVPSGKTVGIVGESGCGKSVTSLSVMRLLQEPQGQITGGAIRFFSPGLNKTADLTKVPTKIMNGIRGNEITMIFQEPMTSLNPVFTIGKQMDEALLYHNPDKLRRKEIRAKSVNALETVGVANPDRIYKSYPHELSGGMRQRVVTATALMTNPKIIIADEPTTALDVTIQAQILELLGDIKNKISSSIIFITHDLGVISEIADYLIVMYAGRVVEEGTTRDIFQTPSHPYTIGLLNSKPTPGADGKKLYSIPGSVPNPVDLPDYCYFRNRCEKSARICASGYPESIAISETHKAACYKLYEGRR
jgi:peptide/nickel transport system ATP-binding protein